MVAGPWAGSASDPHPSQPIANRHRAVYTIYSFCDQWLVIVFGLVNDEERHPPRAYGHCGPKLLTVTPDPFWTRPTLPCCVIALPQESRRASL